MGVYVSDVFFFYTPKRIPIRNKNEKNTDPVSPLQGSFTSDIEQPPRSKQPASLGELGLVNVDAHKKIGQILSICSQGMEWKQNSDINQGL